MSGKIERKPIVLRNIGVMFRNFTGEARRFNTAGDRNFNAALSADQAEMMAKLGFNIKTLPARDEWSEDTHLLKVKVSYRYNPPSVKLLTSKATRELDEDTIDILDKISIQHCDISVMPSEWTQSDGRTGVSAYLWSARVTMLEDPLDFDEPVVDDEEVPF